MNFFPQLYWFVRNHMFFCTILLKFNNTPINFKCRSIFFRETGRKNRILICHLTTWSCYLITCTANIFYKFFYDYFFHRRMKCNYASHWAKNGWLKKVWHFVDAILIYNDSNFLHATKLYDSICGWPSILQWSKAIKSLK